MKKRLNLSHIIFVLYCLIVIWTILFKAAFTFEDIRSLISERSINPIPFYYDHEVGLRFHLLEIILNVIIFIPLGFYLKMLVPSFKKVLTASLIFTVTLEACQLILCLGACDITDLITNFTGAAFGAFVYTLMIKVFKNKQRFDKVINIFALVVIALFFSLALLLFLAIR